MIVVAEGAGQQLLAPNPKQTDASGNRRLGDIGLYLRDKINHFFQSLNIAITLKYIDPSYAIRSVPASPQDNVYCSILAKSAVHAGMAGKTNMLVGRWHDTANLRAWTIHPQRKEVFRFSPPRLTSLAGSEYR